MATTTKFVWLKTLPQISSGLGFNKAFNIYQAQALERYMNPFVPMQTGILSQTTSISADSLAGYVTYSSIYAHYQYNGTGFNFSTEQHPLATSHWDKAMVTMNGFQYARELDSARKRFTL